MRPILVCVIGIFSLGTVWTYARISEWLKPPPPNVVAVAADGHYALTIQFSFDQGKESEGNLEVKLNGNQVFASSEPNSAGQTITVKDLPVQLGGNRLFVIAKSALLTDDQQQKNAEAFLLGEEKVKLPTFICIRVQVFRDDLRVPGCDFTAHADGQSQIILDQPFEVANSGSTPTPENGHLHQ